MGLGKGGKRGHGSDEDNLGFDAVPTFAQLMAIPAEFKEFDYLEYIEDWRVVAALSVLVAVFFGRIAMGLREQHGRNNSHFYEQIKSVLAETTATMSSDPVSDDFWSKGEEQSTLATLAQFLNLFAIDVLILVADEENRVVTSVVVIGAIFFRGCMQVISHLGRRKARWRIWERVRMTTIEVKGVYQDLGTPYLKTLVVFGAQSMLMLYYVHSLIWVLPQFHNSRIYAFWMSSIPIQLLVKQMLSFSFTHEGDFWAYAFTRLDSSSTMLERDGCEYVVPSSMECWLRCGCSMVSHYVYLQTILYTLPLQLMPSASGMDFVKDTFAIVFIPSLDLYQDSKKYKAVVRVFG